MPANHWSNEVGDRVRVCATAFSQSSLAVHDEELNDWSRDIDITIHTLSTGLWKETAKPRIEGVSLHLISNDEHTLDGERSSLSSRTEEAGASTT
jgi:hypothetical protein